jgi:hypothetical protein
MNEIAPMTAIPADYAALGVCQGFDPVKPEDTRQVILGPEGSGKSFFVLGMPDTMIFDFDLKGSKHMPNPRAWSVPITNNEFLVNLVNKLCEDAAKGRRPVRRIVFDTVDQWVDMTARAMGETMTDENKEVADIRFWGKEGAGYTRLNNTLFGLIKKLEIAGYTWTAVCHITEKEITVNGDRKTVARPAIHNTFYKVLARNCEMIMMIATERQVREVTRMYQGRAINTGKTEEYYEFVLKAGTTGSLFGTTNNKVRLPDFNETIILPNPKLRQYGWDLLAEKYNQRVSQTKTEIIASEPKPSPLPPRASQPGLSSPPV